MWIISGSVGGFVLITVLPYLFYLKWKINKDKKSRKKQKNDNPRRIKEKEERKP